MGHEYEHLLEGAIKEDEAVCQHNSYRRSECTCSRDI